MSDGMTTLTEHLGAVAARAGEDVTDPLAAKLVKQGVDRLLKAAKDDASAINRYAELGLDPKRAAKGTLPTYSMLRCPEVDREHAIRALIEHGWMTENKDGGGRFVYSYSIGVPFGPARTETSKNRKAPKR